MITLEEAQKIKGVYSRLSVLERAHIKPHELQLSDDEKSVLSFINDLDSEQAASVLQVLDYAQIRNDVPGIERDLEYLSSNGISLETERVGYVYGLLSEKFKGSSLSVYHDLAHFAHLKGIDKKKVSAPLLDPSGLQIRIDNYVSSLEETLTDYMNAVLPIVETLLPIDLHISSDRDYLLHITGSLDPVQNTTDYSGYARHNRLLVGSDGFRITKDVLQIGLKGDNEIVLDLKGRMPIELSLQSDSNPTLNTALYCDSVDADFEYDFDLRRKDSFSIKLKTDGTLISSKRKDAANVLQRIFKGSKGKVSAAEYLGATTLYERELLRDHAGGMFSANQWFMSDLRASHEFEYDKVGDKLDIRVYERLDIRLDENPDVIPMFVFPRYDSSHFSAQNSTTFWSMYKVFEQLPQVLTQYCINTYRETYFNHPVADKEVLLESIKPQLRELYNLLHEDMPPIPNSIDDEEILEIPMEEISTT